MGDSYHFRWILILSIFIFILSMSTAGRVSSQMKRDQENAKDVEKINPLSPAVKVTGKVIDNTVGQVLPFDMSTESQLVKSEGDCYASCKQERDDYLTRHSSETERGFAWNQYHKCEESCPERAYHETEERQRAPAGSVIDSTKSR